MTNISHLMMARWLRAETLPNLRKRHGKPIGTGGINRRPFDIDES